MYSRACTPYDERGSGVLFVFNTGSQYNPPPINHPRHQCISTCMCASGYAYTMAYYCVLCECMHTHTACTGHGIIPESWPFSVGCPVGRPTDAVGVCPYNILCYLSIHMYKIIHDNIYIYIYTYIVRTYMYTPSYPMV